MTPVNNELCVSARGTCVRVAVARSVCESMATYFPGNRYQRIKVVFKFLIKSGPARAAGRFAFALRVYRSKTR